MNARTSIDKITFIDANWRFLISKSYFSMKRRYVDIATDPRSWLSNCTDCHVLAKTEDSSDVLVYSAAQLSTLHHCWPWMMTSLQYRGIGTKGLTAPYCEGKWSIYQRGGYGYRKLLIVSQSTSKSVRPLTVAIDDIRWRDRNDWAPIDILFSLGSRHIHLDDVNKNDALGTFHHKEAVRLI